MNLSQHTAHRNDQYLSWLRTQNCIVSNVKAECAHHIRLGTNGGTGIKPSDYFCIPLTNENHTTGSNALHLIGEDTFLEMHQIDKEQMFVYYLSKFIKETLEIKVPLTQMPLIAIKDLIDLIESKRERKKTVKKSKPKKVDPYYEKAKELNREHQKEMRAKIKESAPKPKKVSITENEYYQLAKEEKRLRDKELRRKIKESSKTKKKVSMADNPFYQKAKEVKRLRDKEMRKKLKEQKKLKK